MKQSHYKTIFIDTIPSKIDEGIIYISLKYKIAIHKCACGCGEEVSTPLSKKQGWIISYDGENSSLYPSIGNGAYKCRSHYWLKDGDVKWLSPITTNPIRDTTKKEKRRIKFFGIL